MENNFAYSLILDRLPSFADNAPWHVLILLISELQNGVAYVTSTHLCVEVNVSNVVQKQ